MGEKEGRNFSKSGRKWDLEYFCEIEMNLRLRQNVEMSFLKMEKNIFAEFKLDLECVCPKRRQKRNWTQKIFVQKSKKGERELDLK